MPLSRFSPAPFRPHGRTTPAALVTLFALCVVSGFTAGLLGGVIKNIFWLVVLFPLLFGGLAALGCWGAVKLAKIHNAWLAGFCGLLGGALVVAALHAYVNSSVCPPFSLLAQLDPDQLTGCLAARVEAGMSITRHGTATELGATATAVFWGFEALLMLVLPVVGAVQAAREPFCERCQGWLQARQMGSLQGAAADARRALEEGALDRLGSWLAVPSGASWQRLPAGEMAVVLHACPRCTDQSPVLVRLYSGRAPKGRKKEQPSSRLECELAYPAAAAPAIDAAFRVPTTA